jgi:tetratricopeptide (TPR) repeat protein
MKGILCGVLVLGVWTLFPSTAGAQQTQTAGAQTPGRQKPPTRNLLAEMQSYTQALGVTCEFCHSAPANSGLPEPKKDIARTMIAMTRDLNVQVQLATGKAPVEATRVECATCHRGVTIPRRLGELIAETLQYKGADAAVAQYRDLRDRYFGRGSYDFGEDELVNVARPIASVRPDDAITLLKLNIEFNPRSAKSYALMGFAYTRKFDDASAIINVQRAVEIEPENGEFQGQLAQLKMFQRKR